jgi:hypothetical protein
MMRSKQFAKPAAVIAAVVAIGVVGFLVSSSTVRANDDEKDPRIQKGFELAADIPIPLNLEGKDRDKVGLGSYLVNAVGDCNGCHSAADPTTGAPLEFLPNGNPYFLGVKEKKVNPAAYLAGGQDFGAFPGSNPPVHIVPRNLTPDKTGRAEGGRTFAQFLQIMRHGTDLDHLHPNCSSPTQPNCLAPPFNGDLLQIMPWSTYQDMTQDDLHAIYEYLSAIPCIEGPEDPNNILHHDCH